MHFPLLGFMRHLPLDYLFDVRASVRPLLRTLHCLFALPHDLPSVSIDFRSENLNRINPIIIDIDPNPIHAVSISVSVERLHDCVSCSSLYRRCGNPSTQSKANSERQTGNKKIVCELVIQLDRFGSIDRVFHSRDSFQPGRHRPGQVHHPVWG
jgi:hypothetical protein